VLLAEGFAQLFGKNAARWLLVAGVTVLAILDVSGVHAYMLPYYTGVTVHVGDRVPALKLTAFSASEIFSRLAMFGPAFATAGVLKLMWGGYLLATGLLAWVAWRLGREARSGV
jgi:hypothetical protein